MKASTGSNPHDKILHPLGGDELSERLLQAQKVTEGWRDFVWKKPHVIEFLLSGFIVREADLEYSIAIQPNLFIAAAEILAETIREEQKAKYELDALKGRIDIDFRNNPSAFGLDKVTDRSARSVIDTHQEIIEAKERYTQAQAKSKFADCLLSATFSRGDVWQHVARLRGMSYKSEGGL